jgi:polar amino acid transport system substrate-binding protein
MGVVMPRLRLVCGILSLLLAAPSMAADLSAVTLVEKGTLTYGVAATFSPFEFTKDGKPAGFDIDMIGLLSKKLGVATSPMNMEFKGLIVALQGGRLDIINSAMYINEQRASQVDFVPYLKLGSLVIVQAANPSKITGRDDTLCGKTVAVTLGGIQESYARNDDKQCRERGLAGITVMTMPTAQDSALTVRQGRADAFYNSTPGAVELMDKVPGVYAVAGSEFENTTRIGMAVRKGDAAMKAALETALKEIAADGSYKKLIETWKFPASVSLFD